MPRMSEPEKKKTPTWAIVLMVMAGIALLGILGLGVLSALAASGVRKYLEASKSVEGRITSSALARDIAACSDQKPELPDTASPVPATLADVKGKKYLSGAADWSAPAYECARFSLSAPQYYQYQWTRTSATSGRVVAQADLDGDGKVDSTFTATVTCTTAADGLACTATAPPPAAAP